MKKVLRLTLLVSFTAFASSAFAVPRPDLYPNEYFRQVGPERARRDINDCSVAANDYLGESSRTRARGALGETAKGAAKGALAATIMGSNAGRGAGAGAALGGLKGVGTARSESQYGSAEYQKYVEACLEDRGYKIVGWKAQ